MCWATRSTFRDGRVVDQLNALDDASRRAGLTASVGLDLLGLADQERLAPRNGALPDVPTAAGRPLLEELLGKARPRRPRSRPVDPSGARS
jgi:hypothetical protein